MCLLETIALVDVISCRKLNSVWCVCVCVWGGGWLTQEYYAGGAIVDQANSVPRMLGHSG